MKPRFYILSLRLFMLMAFLGVMMSGCSMEGNVQLANRVGNKREFAVKAATPLPRLVKSRTNVEVKTMAGTKGKIVAEGDLGYSSKANKISLRKPGKETQKKVDKHMRTRKTFAKVLRPIQKKAQKIESNNFYKPGIASVPAYRSNADDKFLLLGLLFVLGGVLFTFIIPFLGILLAVVGMVFIVLYILQVAGYGPSK